MVGTNMTIFKDVIISPQKAFVEIGNNGKKYFPFAFVILLGTVISSPILSYYVNSQIYFHFVEETLPFDFSSIFFEIELGFLYGIGFTYLAYTIGKKIGGQGSFKGVFSSLCFAALPITIVGFFILLSLGFVSLSNFKHGGAFSLYYLMIIVIVIWGFVLGLFAIIKSHQLSFLKAILTMLTSGVIIIAISIPILFLIELNDQIPHFKI
ncbi:YIP1 family protein [Nitrosarchaeum sp.]|uniref:YIP1 family protein n=1 Tax=Nitrosarchaeum sp. TaxID=2026886 RepID=UPI00247B6EAF|nr:YIP1 family protein [Nitrosarchaeum sp.]MCV0412932.1 YIP1 family protein [Nitrosarchaeum sp.]